MRTVEVNGYTYEMTDEDADAVTRMLQRAEYLDKRQYILKLKLNSLYGALSNPHFRHFDPRLGNSTTGTGRFILEHMAKSVGEFFDGEYTYPSKSAIYGDTDSAYFSTNASSYEEAVQRADEFATFLNASMEGFMQRMFLCKGKYARQIKVAREVVADSGIFVEKKMYMLHVVNKKGKRSDEMKVMGLLLKKTLVPKKISEGITHIFEEFLKGTMDWRQFTRAVIDMRNDLINSPDKKLIGRPGTVKQLGRHTDLSSALMTAKTTGTTVAGHVRAALLYNDALKRYGDKESAPISSGTKIRLYKLREPEHGAASIAIPADIDPIPQWFIDEYWPKIDMKEQLSGIFDSPIAQVLDAIGKLVPTENDLVAEECLDF